MKCILLAADYGIKFGNAYGDSLPKALLTVRNIPVIEHIINKIQFVPAVREIDIVVKRCFEKKFRQWMSNRSFAVPVTIVEDGSVSSRDNLGPVKDLVLTIGRVACGSDVIVVGADNIFSFSLASFVEYACMARPNPTIGIYDYPGGHQMKHYGIVYRGVSGIVSDFCEKPACFNGSRLVSVCIYYFPKETLPLIAVYLDGGGDPFSMGKYIHWLMRRCILHTYEFKGGWLDVGNADRYAEAVCTF